MFFSWCVLLFLASYGFSGAQSNHVALQYRGYGDAERDAEEYGVSRAEEESGQGIVSGGLEQVIKLTSAMIEGSRQVKRSGYRRAAVLEIAEDLDQKIKEAQLYASAMEKYLEKEVTKQTRSAGRQDRYD